MMRTAPCMGCMDRRLGCHAECWRYIDWANERQTVRKKQREEQQLNQALNEVKERTIKRKKGKK